MPEILIKLKSKLNLLTNLIPGEMLETDDIKPLVVWK